MVMKNMADNGLIWSEGGKDFCQEQTGEKDLQGKEARWQQQQAKWQQQQQVVMRIPRHPLSPEISPGGDGAAAAAAATPQPPPPLTTAAATPTTAQPAAAIMVSGKRKHR